MGENMAEEFEIDYDSINLYTDIEFPLETEEDSIAACATVDNGTTAQPSALHLNAAQTLHLLIGNLTYWTNADDLKRALVEIGVKDAFRTIFFSYHSNGMSIGICSIFLSSEVSMLLVFEKLKSKEIHGQVPVVTYATKNDFEWLKQLQKCKRFCIAHGMVQPEVAFNRNHMEPSKYCGHYELANMNAKPHHPSTIGNNTHNDVAQQHALLSHAEYKSITKRNEELCKTAIDKAELLAASNIGRALATLSTAITMIKQSKLSKHVQTYPLINLLEDTMYKIEYRQRTTHRVPRSQPAERNGHDESNQENETKTNTKLRRVRFHQMATDK